MRKVTKEDIEKFVELEKELSVAQGIVKTAQDNFNKFAFEVFGKETVTLSEILNKGYEAVHD